MNKQIKALSVLHRCFENDSLQSVCDSYKQWNQQLSLTALYVANKAVIRVRMDSRSDSSSGFGDTSKYDVIRWWTSRQCSRPRVQLTFRSTCMQHKGGGAAPSSASTSRLLSTCLGGACLKICMPTCPPGSDGEHSLATKLAFLRPGPGRPKRPKIGNRKQCKNQRILISIF